MAGGRAGAAKPRNNTARAGTGGTVALLWLRQDLRLVDHHALAAALAQSERVLPVFVLDQAAGGDWAPGGASRWWLHHSLESLGRAFAERGTTLILRRGDAASIIPALAREIGAASVQCGLAHEPWLRRLDARVAAALEADGRRLVAHRVSTLFDLDAIRSKTGTRYGIYTPFARTCRALPDPEPPLPAPSHVPGPDTLPASDQLPDWHLLPTTPDWAGGMRDTWTPGEAGAARHLHDFLDARLDGYGQSRNVPGDPKGTSMLSPHLHWGELSANQVWHAAREAAARLKGSRAGGFETFQSEILWHEFAAYLLWHNPTLPDVPMRAAFAGLPWRDDTDGLRAWSQGRTGIPIVDAGMRQLWQLGWMHNRVRMITASFLTKHMLLPWQRGRALVLGHAGRCRPRHQCGELAVGRRYRHRQPAVLPDLQPGHAGQEVRSRRPLRAAVRARGRRLARSLAARPLGSAGSGARQGRPATRPRLSPSDRRPRRGPRSGPRGVPRHRAQPCRRSGDARRRMSRAG